MPLAVLGLMSVASPGYLRLLWVDPVGVRLVWYALAVAAGGVLWMRKVIRIRA